jgi:hypothetical protein
MATITNYNIDQGSDWSTIVTAKDSSGAVIDLSNRTITSHMRKNYTSTASTAISGIAKVASAGTLTLNLTSAVSAAMKSGYYYYDVEVTTGSIVTRILEGKIHLRPEVTKVSE